MTDVVGTGRGGAADPERNGLKQSLDAFEQGCADLGATVAPAVRPKISKAFRNTFEQLESYWAARGSLVLAAARFGGQCAAAHAGLKGNGGSVRWTNAAYGLMQAQAECQADFAARGNVTVMRAWCQGVTLDAEE